MGIIKSKTNPLGDGGIPWECLLSCTLGGVCKNDKLSDGGSEPTSRQSRGKGSGEMELDLAVTVERCGIICSCRHVSFPVNQQGVCTRSCVCSRRVSYWDTVVNRQTYMDRKEHVCTHTQTVFLAL